MPTERRFARVYFDDFKRDYPTVWRSDAMLATWLRLLVESEKAWPSPPEIPRSVTNRTMRQLREVGLVTEDADHHFEVRGFVAERSKRAQSGRSGAAQRWQSDRTANASPDAMLERERERREKEKGVRERRPLAPGGRANDGLVDPDEDAA